MLTRHPRLAGRFRLVTLTFLIGAALQAPAASPAAAAIVACRGDPIVWLSNGETIQIIAEVAASAAEVQEVVYTIHVPLGATMTRVVYDSGPLDRKESVALVDDLLPYHYTTDTLVMTYRNGIAITASTSMDMIRDSASGWNDEHITIALHR
jgi:hypothetical protein